MSAAADSTPSQPASTRGATTAADHPSRPLFQERLLPGVGAWIVVAVVGLIVGVVLIPLSYAVAIAVGVIGLITACTLAYLTSPVLIVTESHFTMGRARIDVELLGEPTVLAGEDWQTTMSTGFEPLAHHCTRGWIHSGIRTEVLDDQDPITAWVCSSRRPEDLALALRTTQQASASD